MDNKTLTCKVLTTTYGQQDFNLQSINRLFIIYGWQDSNLQGINYHFILSKVCLPNSKHSHLIIYITRWKHLRL